MDTSAGVVFKSLGAATVLLLAAAALAVIFYLVWMAFRERHPRRPYWERQRERRRH